VLAELTIQFERAAPQVAGLIGSATVRAMTRIVAVADLHGNLPDDLPGGDVLVIAGDVCPLADHAVGFQERWLANAFRNWTDALTHREIVWIAGNHDFVCELPGWRPSCRGRYLLDSATDVAGLSFYGTPWVPNLPGWAFHAGNEDLLDRMLEIPRVDVLISHGPPHGYGDLLRRGGRAGSEALTARLEVAPPRLCLCGHIHEDHGRWRIGEETTVANVAYVDADYRVRPQAAQVFDL